MHISNSDHNSCSRILQAEPTQLSRADLPPRLPVCHDPLWGQSDASRMPLPGRLSRLVARKRRQGPGTSKVFSSKENCFVEDRLIVFIHCQSKNGRWTGFESTLQQFQLECDMLRQHINYELEGDNCNNRYYNSHKNHSVIILIPIPQCGKQFFFLKHISTPRVRFAVAMEWLTRHCVNLWRTLANINWIWFHWRLGSVLVSSSRVFIWGSTV